MKGDEIISSYYDTDTTCSSTPFSVTNYTIGKCVQYNDGNNNNAYMYSVVDSISIPYSSSSYQVVSYNGTGCGKYDTIFSLSVFGPNFCNANVGGSSSSYLKCDQTSFYTKNYLTIDCTSVIHDTESAAFSCNDYGSSFLENSCFSMLFVLFNYFILFNFIIGVNLFL